MRRLQLLLLCFTFSVITLSAQKSKIMVDGYVRNKSGEALSFSSLHVRELKLDYLANVDGYFRFAIPHEGSYSLVVNYLNHKEAQLPLMADQQGDIHLDIVLEENSYALDEVLVMAKHKMVGGSISEVNQVALEHIQPTSIADVLILTPGGLYTNNKITGFNRISLRQSGTDNNTSLGTAIIADGIPMDNDGYRSQVPGFSSDYDFSGRVGLNEGFDLKTFSTDHIQKIEIVKGISSAKVGNLSSGVIQVSSKIGQSPLQVRLKADPLNKLCYVGKGTVLPKKRGTLHAGLDYVSAYDDKRDPMSEYRRVTGQLTYTNSGEIMNRPLYLFLKLSEVYTLNQSKEDELILEYNESFKNYYSRSGLSFKARLTDVSAAIDDIELISFVDYTYDLIDRNRLVQTGTPLPSPLAEGEGEKEGVYLPSKYYSPFKIDNKPLTILTQLNLQSLFQTFHLQHKLIYGLEWKHTKNHGKGAIIDMTRPPYPGDNSYVRPRPNKIIPALVVGSAYVEDQLHLSKGNIDYNLSAGVRATKMFNLEAQYLHLNALLFEPRINFSLTHQMRLKGGRRLNNNFRLGFGQENKLPTLDFLYPDYIYKDFVILSAYVKKDYDYNYLLTQTRKYGVTNYGLKANKNNKIEIGWDLSSGDFLFAVTAFKEFSVDGFKNNGLYDPISFLRYFNIKDGNTIVGRRPQKSDYNPEQHETFVERPFVQNSGKLEKKGVEYRLKFPKIPQLATSIEINGAYYDTQYSESKPREHHPSFKDDNKPMPYVGIYTDPDIVKRTIFNTNVWLNTNIPSLKMVFTTFCQLVWVKDNRRINGSFYPTSYLDLEGQRHPVDERVMQKIKEQDVVWRHYHLYQEPYYEKEPVSIAINFKATKEFNKHIRGAFFVNNILDINPAYKNRYEQNVRIWRKPFFGAEMTILF